MKKLGVFATAMSFGLGMTPLLADIPLVQEGQAMAVIAIGTEATPTERHAARVLAGYVQKMTGVRLRITTTASTPRNPNRALILIGRPETNALIGQLAEEGSVRLSADEPGLDGYVIQTVGNGEQGTGTTPHEYFSWAAAATGGHSMPSTTSWRRSAEWGSSGMVTTFHGGGP